MVEVEGGVCPGFVLDLGWGGVRGCTVDPDQSQRSVVPAPLIAGGSQISISSSSGASPSTHPSSLHPSFILGHPLGELALIPHFPLLATALPPPPSAPPAEAPGGGAGPLVDLSSSPAPLIV